MTTDILQFPLGPELSSHVWFIELFEADKKRKSQADAKWCPGNYWTKFLFFFSNKYGKEQPQELVIYVWKKSNS